jgi:hypothetical protein
MRRLSSKMTFFYKRVFPVFWFGFGFLLLLIAVPLFFGGAPNDPPPFLFLIVPLFMMGFGYFVMKKLVFDLVDEVWDDGETLLIKNGGREQRVELRDIKNVGYSTFINPSHVTLSVRQPTTFGEQIAFMAPVPFVPFSTSPIINELIERVDQARQRRG